MHMADMGTDNFEQEFTLGLVEKDRNLLREINNALSKIQNGTYGICEGTGIPIGKVRLEAAPWARFSIEYARKKKKTGWAFARSEKLIHRPPANFSTALSPRVFPLRASR